MKRISFLLFSVVIIITANAQVKSPVHWSFSSKKITTNTFEVHLTATIEKGWHIYSQNTPEGGPVPTSIGYQKNPLLVMVDTAKELGKIEQHHEPLFGVDVKQFSKAVDFVQVVKLKAKAKTAVSGAIEFMTCNDTECLPPKAVRFYVAIP